MSVGWKCFTGAVCGALMIIGGAALSDLGVFPVMSNSLMFLGASTIIVSAASYIE